MNLCKYYYWFMFIWVEYTSGETIKLSSSWFISTFHHLPSIPWSWSFSLIACVCTNVHVIHVPDLQIQLVNNTAEDLLVVDNATYIGSWHNRLGGLEGIIKQNIDQDFN